MNSFEFCYPVRMDDLDSMGIVGNSNWLTILERARIDMLDKIGFSLPQMTELKIGGVVAESNVKYLRPARFGDRLTVKIIGSLPVPNGGTLNYVVTNANGKPCLSAELKIVFIDHTGRSTEIPPIIHNALYGTNEMEQM